jgi:hypothetical protein
MFAYFNRFELQLTKAQAESVSHSGQCDDDVAALLRDKKIARQLDKISPDKIRDELREYGAWDAEELADDEQNRRRIIWIAGGNICDELVQRR